MQLSLLSSVQVRAKFNFGEFILRQAQDERHWCFKWQTYFMHVPYLPFRPAPLMTSTYCCIWPNEYFYPLVWLGASQQLLPAFRQDASADVNLNTPFPFCEITSLKTARL